MKRILVVAGSDSSGGAGIEADQKVIAAHKCYAMTATTALTAQNTLGVLDIHETPSEFVQKQINACVEDVGVDVVKTGMLASAGTISALAKALQHHKVPISVVDPVRHFDITRESSHPEADTRKVMVSTTGSQLLPEHAIKTICTDLLPHTTILTPNIPEANLILREAGVPAIEVNDVQGLKAIALAIHKLGPKYVLVKGGHLPLTTDLRRADSDEEKQYVVNLLHGESIQEVIQMPYSGSKNTHGTGCSLASAIACNLAKGIDIVKAVRNACNYVDAGIRFSSNLGSGAGPLNHFHSVQVLPFAPDRFVEYLLEREDVQPAWQQFTHHEFVRRIGNGTLPLETFKYYMIQDYLYLIHFARANALAGYKAKTLDDIAGAAEIVTHIRHEINLHIGECKELGLTQEDMEKYDESEACTAYSRYVLDIGQSEDWLALQISLLPCLLGYNVIAKRLHDLQKPDQENRYAIWINNYIAEDYNAAVKKGCAFVERHVKQQSPSRIEELVKIFVHATKMETGFWNMASSA